MQANTLYYLWIHIFKYNLEWCIPEEIHPNFRIMANSQEEGNNTINEDKGISTSF